MEKILDFLRKNYTPVILLIKNIIIVFLFLITLHFIDLWDINLILRYRYIIIIIAFLSSILLLLFFEKNHDRKQFYKPYFILGFILALFLTVTINLVSSFSNNLFFLERYLLAFTAFLGAFSIYLNAERIKAEICAQKEQDKDELVLEAKKKKKFIQKYKSLAKAPILNHIIIWFHTEGRIYSFGLVTIVVGAFILRMHNLTILDPYADEYAHLVAAKDLINIGETTYTRAFFVSYLVKNFLQIGDPASFYEYVFWGRIPGVIFASSTILPLYFLARKINKPIALISSFLFAISPWAIAVSRNIREYAFYPFFILITTLLFLRLLEMILHFKREFLTKIVLYSSLIFIFFYYTYKIDTLSTLRISLLIFPVTALYFFVVNFKQIFVKQRKKAFLILGVLIGLTFSLLIYAINSPHVTFEINISLNSIRFFFNPDAPPMQWWFGNNFNYIAFIFIIAGITYAITKGKKEYILPLAIFTTLIIFFVFFFDRNIRPRYSFYLLPFFTILVSTGIYSIFYFIKNEIKTNSLKYLALIVSIIFILITFNLQNTIYPITSDVHQLNLVTDEYHSKVESTIEFFEEYGIEEDDYFITTIFGSILQLHFDISKERDFYYNYRDEDRFDYVRNIVASKPQGFIVLDSRINGEFAEGFPKEGSFKIGETIVKVLQNKDEMQIYRWE